MNRKISLGMAVTIALHAAGEVLPSRLRWQLEWELHLLAGNA